MYLVLFSFYFFLLFTFYFVIYKGKKFYSTISFKKFKNIFKGWKLIYLGLMYVNYPYNLTFFLLIVQILSILEGPTHILYILLCISWMFHLAIISMCLKFNNKCFTSHWHLHSNNCDLLLCYVCSSLI